MPKKTVMTTVVVPLILAPALNADPLRIADRRQVFIDGRFLTQARDIELVVHPPSKTGEHTFVPERPWEKGGFGTYCCVLHADRTYHLWYPTEAGICYARSADGIRWERPSLGLAEYEGSRDNNIVLGRGAGGIMPAGQTSSPSFMGRPPLPRANATGSEV